MTAREQVGGTPSTTSADGGVLLSARGIVRGFGRGRGRAEVLHGVDCDVRAGECLAIIGGSGSGKSTLTRILAGLDAADAGEVTYRGMPVRRRQPGLRALRRDCGLVFQDPHGSLDPRWTVGRSVAEPLELRRRNRVEGDDGDARDGGDLTGRVAHALQTVGLDPDVFLTRIPRDLSGGQAQRVAIARAIVANPRIVFADEPMSAIDTAARLRILDAFAAIRAARPEMALVMVSHDLGVVQHLADRILVLQEGRVTETGAIAQVLRHPQTAYTRSLIDAASL
ncbi:ATP-binding cassette domain-containing protein [Bifidobacterium pullorum subsp. saeculare]|uniref:ATP-binding cassette domain-containing protein n=1 Tax=Bifidobacterium pullorum subsp. saeculare TaxID=78257 RepID=A0A939B8S7_9BIFI|nr:ATP-binding cassette domain-containing protein [Bifidobacterium pullorum]MBM6698778.1 ATP-binding cassette domain-containing protein [Bifidobacterium pullorum subsp. saeculare]